MKKLTTQEFIAKAQKIHVDDNENPKYDYTNSVYVDNRTKIIITCFAHGIFLQSPDHHLMGQGCNVCGGSKKSNTEEFIKKAKEIHGDKYKYDKVNYINNSTKIIIICGTHEFLQTPSKHLANHGCNICQEAISFGEFERQANFIHDFKFIYLPIKIKNVLDRIEIICFKHGKFSQIISNHLNGNNCKKCSDEKRGKELAKTTKQFILEATIIHKNKYIYNKAEYKNAYTKLLIKCNKHGYFWQEPSNHLKGSGCNKCSKNISNKEIAWLASFNKNLKPTTFKINGKLFKIDGFDPISNTLYEFYGDFWHGNLNVFPPQNIHPLKNKTYQQIYQDTINREMILKENGFNVITIWESDWNKLKIRSKLNDRI